MDDIHSQLYRPLIIKDKNLMNLIPIPLIMNTFDTDTGSHVDIDFAQKRDAALSSNLLSEVST